MEGRKQRDGFKRSSSSSFSSLFKLWLIWGRGGGDDEGCRNWGREMTGEEEIEKMPRRSMKPCSTSSSSFSPFSNRISWFLEKAAFKGSSSSSHRTLFLPTRLVLLTGEEEVQSEEDEDRRWDSRMKVCSWSLWLRTTVFTSCQWFRLWTSLNVSLWRVYLSV